jgi:large subunit ribosomal protein L13
MSTKTTIPTKERVENDHKWYIIDAEDIVLGKVAVKAAAILRGKHKPTFTPHMEMGDHVVIINAEKVYLSGNKTEDKSYFRHSGYPGGITEIKYKDLVVKKPTEAVSLAVKGMLPHNKLGRKIFLNLKVYAGSAHPHEAQQPEIISVN